MKRLHNFVIRFRQAWLQLGQHHHKQVAGAAGAAHLTYFCLVFIESHGLYGIAAGACGLMLIIAWLTGGEVE